jgi:hypothetical protein
MTLVKIGYKFGEWTTIEENKDQNHRRWLCICKCGIKKLVYQCHLKSGKSSACASCANKTHGFSHLRAWVSWSSMRERCLNNRHEAYRHYGGRGIAICERWDSFENFLADMGERPNGLSLERKNTNGDYNPSNCVWATAKEQSNN